MSATASRIRTIIAPFSDEYAPAVRRFNERLVAVIGRTEFQFPDEPPRDGEERFLAVEGGEVRGGYILCHQDFSFAGEPVRIAHYRLPLSEGITDRAYAGVGLQLLRSALRTQPLLYALGMGGFDQPLPRMLQASGWKLLAVPFYFRVNRAYRFLRHLPVLHTSAARRIILNTAAFSGAGVLGVRAFQWYRGRSRPRPQESPSELFRGFSAWADDLWNHCGPRYALAAARQCRRLNQMYPAGSRRFHCLRVFDGGRILGWAVLLDTPMRGDKYFGDLRVGTIADCLAAPEHAAAVVCAATRFLERRGVDLIVSNQSHHAWTAALEACRFVRGPSNYIFAASPELARRLDPFETSAVSIHINRGDGDGPIHL
jgi:hypothetical protein